MIAAELTIDEINSTNLKQIFVGLPLKVSFAQLYEFGQEVLGFLQQVDEGTDHVHDVKGVCMQHDITAQRRLVHVGYLGE